MPPSGKSVLKNRKKYNDMFTRTRSFETLPPSVVKNGKFLATTFQSLRT